MCWASGCLVFAVQLSVVIWGACDMELFEHRAKQCCIESPHAHVLCNYLATLLLSDLFASHLPVHMDLVDPFC